jgi:putative oxidoreductase
MKNMTDIGRIIFAIPFAVFGINHFFNLEILAGLYTTFIPIWGFTIILTGLAMIGVALSIVFKKYIMLSCLILAGMLLIFIVTIHIPQLFFNVTPDPSDIKLTKILSLTNLLKDMSLMGAALMIAGLYPKSINN